MNAQTTVRKNDQGTAGIVVHRGRTETTHHVPAHTIIAWRHNTRDTFIQLRNGIEHEVQDIRQATRWSAAFVTPMTLALRSAQGYRMVKVTH